MSHPLWALIPLTTELPNGTGSVLLFASQQTAMAQLNSFREMGSSNYAVVPAYMDPAEFRQLFGPPPVKQPSPAVERVNLLRELKVESTQRKKMGLRCALGFHKKIWVAATDDIAADWTCSRCGEKGRVCA